mmetsp:Transcript_62621/g.161621  ORF Transcript_62621/g.161621 Transcript_62621/m.161621 type:complete len:234 (-) Transcript_62621:12-713(-)
MSPCESWFGRFLCCCVGSGGGSEQSVTLSLPVASSGGSLLKRASIWDSSAPQEDGSKPVSPHGSGTAAASDCTVSALRNPTLGEGAQSVSLAERDQEKDRLHRLVKDFVKEAVTGVSVGLVCPLTGRYTPHFFQLDRQLTVFSLKPRDGSKESDTAAQYFNMKDVTQIYRGADVALRAPVLGDFASSCVGLDTSRADRRLFFYFEESMERDRFYTCVRILRMSVDITMGIPCA